MADQESDVMTPEEVAEDLRVHATTVYRQLEKGLLPGAFKVGRVWRVLRSALSAMTQIKVPDS